MNETGLQYVHSGPRTVPCGTPCITVTGVACWRLRRCGFENFLTTGSLIEPTRKNAIKNLVPQNFHLTTPFSPHGYNSSRFLTSLFVNPIHF